VGNPQWVLSFSSAVEKGTRFRRLVFFPCIPFQISFILANPFSAAKKNDFHFSKLFQSEPNRLSPFQAIIGKASHSSQHKTESSTNSIIHIMVLAWAVL
jgi:hypothetical protein